MSGPPILVTGSIRSGTTWVGRTLATAPRVALIHEPFNIDHQFGIFAHHWSRQYRYLTDLDEEAVSVEDALTDTLDFRYRPLLHLRNAESSRRSLGLLRDLPRFWWRRRVSHPRPLLKDPIALFSAGWLSERFDVDVVTMVRHPGAFVWSYRRIDEPNRLTDLIQQPALQKGPLEPFVDEIEQAARSDDPIHQAAVLWRVTYATVTSYLERHPDWVVVRHEDLSIRPFTTFSDLFSSLSLPFTERTRRFIKHTTNEKNPVEAPRDKLHHLRRNSRENATSWHARLSPEEIKRVRELTGDVASLYYTDSSWSLPTGTMIADVPVDASS